MRDPVAAVETFLLHPFAALAIGLILLVVGWRMDSSASSYFLFAAWVLLAVSAFRALSGRPLVPRLLLTMLVSSVLGLLLYYLEIRTTKRPAPSSAPSHSEPAQPTLGSHAEATGREPSVPTTSTPPTSEEIAEAIARRSQPSVAARARRHRLRRELTQYLIRGSLERDTFRILLQPTVEEGTRKPVDNTEKIGAAMLRIQEFDTELVSYVGSRLGSDRSLWMMSRSPSARYPSNIGDVPGLSHSWDVVTSDIAKIEELLRELPELPGAEAHLEYMSARKAKELFEWRLEQLSVVSGNARYSQCLVIRATRRLTDPLFELILKSMGSVSVERNQSLLITTTPVREDLRWYVDVLHPVVEGREVVLLIQANDPIELEDVRVAFW